MPVFRNPAALRRHLEEAVAFQIRTIAIEAQAALSDTAVSPYDTGRLRSSWFATLGAPSSQVAPEGTDSPNTDASGLRVSHRDSVFLTNSLPYAQAICLGVNLPPSWGGQHRVVGKPVNWFHTFRGFHLPQLMDLAGEKTKRRFEL